MNRLQRYIAILSITLLFGTVSHNAFANTPVFDNEQTETETNAPKMIFTQGSVRISNASGLLFEVYNVAGIRIAQHRIDSQDKTFTLGYSNGCYILKVGKLVRKISIR